jgi:hypothetical protein
MLTFDNHDVDKLHQRAIGQTLSIEVIDFGEF